MEITEEKSFARLFEMTDGGQEPQGIGSEPRYVVQSTSDYAWTPLDERAFRVIDLEDDRSVVAEGHLNDVMNAFDALLKERDAWWDPTRNKLRSWGEHVKKAHRANGLL